jgi:hypothetical protein
MELQEDRPAFVRFELRAREDRNKTIENGYYTTKDVEVALITPPFSKDCVEKDVTDWLTEMEDHVRNMRMPARWRDHYKASYEAWSKGQEMPVNGTPIKGWRKLSPAQEKNLLAMGVQTVEDLAQINDEGMKRYGMGALQLKNLAIAELKDPNKLAVENAALRSDMDTLKQQMLDIIEQNKEMAKQLRKQEKAAA